MQARIEDDFARRGHSVWLYDDQGGTVVVGRMKDGEIVRWEQVPLGTVPEPTLRLRSGALEAILAEAEKIIPASHATERHLKDALSVRDRLLVLVEKGLE